MKNTSCLIALLVLSACTKDTSPNPEDTSPSSQDTSLSELNMDGRLYRIQSAIRENGCADWGPTFNDSIDGFDLRITFPDTETARFHWEYPQDCSKSGTTVRCSTDEALDLYDYAPDSDALITYEDQLELTWFEPDQATGLWQVDLDCKGTQCEIIGELNGLSYPCSILMDWTLSPSDGSSNE